MPVYDNDPTHVSSEHLNPGSPRPTEASDVPPPVSKKQPRSRFFSDELVAEGTGSSDMLISNPPGNGSPA